jgi:hypothetical protein
MNQYFVITIDVEPDCTPTWHYSNPLTFHGVTYGIKEKLQPLFNKYDACPTYLINNVVLEDGPSTETLLKLEGTYELGTHLHAEFIEPEKRFENYAGKKGEENQCFLDPDIEFAKMKNLTVLFERTFGRRPLSFRAGRFSAGSNTIACLNALGYKVDTSVTPNVRWNDQTRKVAVDYRHTPEQPYFIKENAYPEKDPRGSILEVPVSISMARQWILFKKPLWLRPYMSDISDFKKVMKYQSRKHMECDLLVFNMMFHNVEVLPKLSPYPQTENESKVYLDSIEAFLAHCKRNQIKSIGLSDLYDIYRRT